MIKPDPNRTPKACEPCRRRKVKCDGQKPCRLCHDNPLACVYRLKARSHIRRPASISPTADSNAAGQSRRPPTPSAAAVAPAAAAQDAAGSRRYNESVVAVHRAPKSTDSSQLFYGSSSNFAFLQHIHRTIISYALPAHAHSGSEEKDAGEDDSGLDTFMQRNVFFGVPLKVNPVSVARFDARSALTDLVQKPAAVSYLDNFKTASLHLLPFITASSLDHLLDRMYSPEIADAHMIPPRWAIMLMILAIGALSTTQTEVADTLFLAAKREAAIYEDSVTLPMIQLSLLMADYQLNMGRPSSGYLHIGNACRKGLAMGLNNVAANSVSHEVEERNSTLWCLYFFET